MNQQAAGSRLNLGISAALRPSAVPTSRRFLGSGRYPSQPHITPELPVLSNVHCCAAVCAYPLHPPADPLGLIMQIDHAHTRTHVGIQLFATKIPATVPELAWATTDHFQGALDALPCGNASSPPFSVPGDPLKATVPFLLHIKLSKVIPTTRCCCCNAPATPTTIKRGVITRTKMSFEIVNNNGVISELFNGTILPCEQDIDCPGYAICSINPVDWASSNPQGMCICNL